MGHSTTQKKCLERPWKNLRKGGAQSRNTYIFLKKFSVKISSVCHFYQKKITNNNKNIELLKIR